MNLKQQLTQRVKQEAREKIAVIDANVGKIAEAEVLIQRLNRFCPGDPIFQELICVHHDSITANIGVFFERASTVYAAIAAADLKIGSETNKNDLDPIDREIKLVGLDTTIIARCIAEELQQAA